MIQKLKIGTLVEDQGKIGVVMDFFPKGTNDKDAERINWRDNYKIYYTNNDTYIIGAMALHRLLDTGQIKIVRIPVENKK
tara:strand:- start:295 stop:534 length:240 start_codon:yes stop_codon:yes gene_type:complete